MQLSNETMVPRNSGAAFEVRQGQYIRIRGWTIVDFVAFNLHNLQERFDQGRTKANQNTIYVTTDHVLYSKFNNPLLTIVADTFAGHHDLQKGMCSRSRFELAHRKGIVSETYTHGASLNELPEHGCWENLSAALGPFGVAPEDIPSPLNIFQHMDIDVQTGRMVNTRLRPDQPEGAYLTLRAEIDCLAAVSACPDTSVGGREIYVTIMKDKG